MRGIEPPPGSILGIGDPSGWAWAYLRSHIMWRGHYRLFHVPARYRSQVAAIAEQHGLSVHLLAGGVLELVPAESPWSEGWEGEGEDSF